MSSHPSPSMLALLMKAYNWFDIALQQSVEHFGIPRLSRQQSMLMTNLIYSDGRPMELARALGVSRQAIHYTIRELVELDLIEVVPDPSDGRGRIVRMSANGLRLSARVRAIVAALEEELASRIGKRAERTLHAALAREWGEPPMVREWPDQEAVGQTAKRDRRSCSAPEPNRRRSASR